MKIGIVAAMEEEKRLLIEEMDIQQETDIAGWTFIQGRLRNQEIVLVQSGIGKVMSAIATTLLIHHFNVKRVLNTGSAGGLGEQLEIGDVVIATELAYSDVDVTAFGYEYGQLPKMPVRFQSAIDGIDHVIQAANAVGLKATTGLIVSADAFIHQEEQYQSIFHHFPDVLATEMEGAAIAHVCHTFGVECIVIRAVSDKPLSGHSAMSFDEFVLLAGKKSAEMIGVYLESLSN